MSSKYSIADDESPVGGLMFGIGILEKSGGCVVNTALPIENTKIMIENY